MSFLQEAGTSVTWNERDLAKALQIGTAEAKEVLSVLQLQGYVEPAGSNGKWRITDAGALVSGAKPARYTRQSVETTLEGLGQRIRAVNEDPNAPYSIAEVLSDKASLQPANVGIRVIPRRTEPEGTAAKRVGSFLRQRRGKSALLHVTPYEAWMTSRTHLKLL